jgi:hypothetical protein
VFVDPAEYPAPRCRVGLRPLPPGLPAYSGQSLVVRSRHSARSRFLRVTSADSGYPPEPSARSPRESLGGSLGLTALPATRSVDGSWCPAYRACRTRPARAGSSSRPRREGAKRRPLPRGDVVGGEPPRLSHRLVRTPLPARRGPQGLTPWSLFVRHGGVLGGLRFPSQSLGIASSARPIHPLVYGHGRPREKEEQVSGRAWPAGLRPFLPARRSPGPRGRGSRTAGAGGSGPTGLTTPPFASLGRSHGSPGRPSARLANRPGEAPGGEGGWAPDDRAARVSLRFAREASWPARSTSAPAAREYRAGPSQEGGESLFGAAVRRPCSLRPSAEPPGLRSPGRPPVPRKSRPRPTRVAPAPWTPGVRGRRAVALTEVGPLSFSGYPPPLVPTIVTFYG